MRATADAKRCTARHIHESDNCIGLGAIATYGPIKYHRVDPRALSRFVLLINEYGETTGRKPRMCPDW